MKNKKVTYLLIVFVAVVWGLIGYRVFAALNSDEDGAVTPQKAAIVKEPIVDYTRPEDTVKLNFNYRDPFEEGKEAPPVKVAALAAPVAVSRPAMPMGPPPINWGMIQYTGYIRNPDTKKLIALLTVNGKSLMLAEGEQGEGLKLLKNLKDSVKVAYQNKTKFIALN
ncbi:hypothetical protein [Mucilaginibacter pedocola]|uniref:Type II secretion system protein GspC N-terminal domain-containing protein n=1 Tax=Mucilaginibacter pedocola TaxID=1792845 RepID=A0A1S9PBH6_9SPHI|nr:hypothetical protein [Mucilaginibacter pedocola]OOQ58334.1 hypothetical protein BC343_11920 [Mucilaginibacter pedocola]